MKQAIHPRFSLRALLIAVTLLALALGSISPLTEVWRLRQRYLTLAEIYEGASDPASTVRLSDRAKAAEFERLNAERWQFYAALEEKYRRAAAQPWRAVEPDPVDPQYPLVEVHEDGTASLVVGRLVMPPEPD